MLARTETLQPKIYPQSDPSPQNRRAPSAVQRRTPKWMRFLRTVCSMRLDLGLVMRKFATFDYCGRGALVYVSCVHTGVCARWQ